MADKKKSKSGAGAASNVVAFGAAERRLARKRRFRDDPPPHQARDGVYPNRKNKPPNWKADDLGLPVEDPCPVECVGHKDGEYFYISSSGEFRSIGKHDVEAMQKLFALCPNWPRWAFPRWGKKPPKSPDDEGPSPPPPIENFDADDLRTHLIRACERQGMFDPDVKMRGRGGWALRGGQLVYHAGEELWTYEGQPGDGRFRMLATGMHDGHLYPRLAELPAPWTAPIGASDNQAGPLLAGFRTSNWRRPEVDPVLLLGWLGVAYLGGALDWRSSVLLLGDKGWGKSTIHDGFKVLFGDALLHSANTSAAGVYQDLAHDSRPCELDEIEPGAHQAKVDDLVDLMRQSASGSVTRRGSAGGKAVAYQMQSAFMFSAINNPIHDPADLSRVAVLRLRPLEAGLTDAPVIDGERCGPMLLARMMSQWGNAGEVDGIDKMPGWNFTETRKLYMDALATGGHDARGQKTYGTLLACAELLLGPELADELGVKISRRLEDGKVDQAALEWWADALAVAKLPEAELTKPNWRRCGDWMLTKAVEPWRGGARTSVGQAIADMITAEKMMLDKAPPPGEHGHYTSDQCRRDLARTGLGLRHAIEVLAVYAKRKEVSHAVACAALGLADDDGWLLAVPNDHPELRALFRGQPWERTWMDALRQCPLAGVMVTDPAINRVTIGGSQERCTLIVWKRYQEAPER